MGFIVRCPGFIGVNDEGKMTEQKHNEILDMTYGDVQDEQFLSEVAMRGGLNVTVREHAVRVVALLSLYGYEPEMDQDDLMFLITRNMEPYHVLFMISRMGAKEQLERIKGIDKNNEGGEHRVWKLWEMNEVT